MRPLTKLEALRVFIETEEYIDTLPEVEQTGVTVVLESRGITERGPHITSEDRVVRVWVVLFEGGWDAAHIGASNPAILHFRYYVSSGAEARAYYEKLLAQHIAILKEVKPQV